MFKNLFLVLIFVLSIQGYETKNGVIKMTDQNYLRILKENKEIIIKFFIPTCGHCITLAPKYENAAESI